MIFPDYVQNKTTEFTARRGDDVIKVTYEYDIESLEEVVKAFETALVFFGFQQDDLKDYYRQEIIDELESEDD